MMTLKATMNLRHVWHTKTMSLYGEGINHFGRVAYGNNGVKVEKFLAVEQWWESTNTSSGEWRLIDMSEVTK
jgi:hypothetical protein